MTTVSDQSAVFDLALSLADDALILGHRLSEWSSHAPMLEEDIALSNLALDLIGQARMLYQYAGTLDADGRDEDRLAYFRSDAEYRNCLLVEQPNGDFAHTMARHLCYSAFMHPYFSALSASRDKGLAGIAAKAVKEMAYHRRHAAEWVIRLGDGTDESRARMIAGLDEMWGYTGELFEMTAGEKGLVRQGLAPDRDTLRPQWLDTMAQVLREAGLDAPRDRTMQTGGRSGRHSEHLSHLLGDMQVLARAHPEAKW